MNELEYPVTLEEWQAYVDAIPSDEELYDNALAFGSMKFAQKLMSEGYNAEDISSIRTMVAKKMVDDTVAPPGRVGSCVIDYRELANFPF
jgi:hypothetical protein